MLEQHALGIARRAAGIAEHDRIALAAVDPLGLTILGADPVLEMRRMLRRVETDVVLDRRPARPHPVDDRLEGRIVDQHAVLGMVGDIFELVIEQPRIDRVQHPARAGHAVPGDEVAAVVHRQSGDAIALGHAEPLERLHHFQRVAANGRPGGARLGPIGPLRHDLPRAMLARSVVDQQGGAKLPVLHGAQNGHSVSVP